MSRHPATSSAGTPAETILPIHEPSREGQELLPFREGSRRTERGEKEITIQLSVFDQRHYRRLIEAREETIRRVVRKLKPVLGLVSSLDAGCGVGFFAETLRECGLAVRGFDGRNENVAEARRRFPGIRFDTADAQDREIRRMGKFDLVLCCGLLYHLENPLLAIRNLRALTEKCLLVESMCLPAEHAEMVLREEPIAEDQSLTTLACYVSEATLLKMLYRAGFAAVYRVAPMPDHDDFRETEEHSRRRTMLLASHTAIDVGGFRLMPEPEAWSDPWSKAPEMPRGLAQRVRRFAAKPTRQKYAAVAMRLRKFFPGMAMPLRLDFGAWWLAEHSAMDQKLIYRRFEELETKFVQRLLKPGMTMVDAGAHHGLYSLLGAKQVGRSGQVVAIEPSERERKRLERHLRVNRCRNVRIAACALGDKAGEEDLYVVQGENDWCNSLRPPDVDEPTQKLRVPVKTLDEVLEEMGIREVDFLKLDVEGAELSALKGADELLRGARRPVILAELQDLRTRPWGYGAREIVNYLAERKYVWFALKAEGGLMRVEGEEERYDTNLVAAPEERMGEVGLRFGQSAV